MRAAKGITLVETLITASVMSFIGISMMSILFLNYKTNAKVASVEDNISALRNVRSRLTADIREGRALGDVFGTSKSTLDGTAFPTSSSSFPSQLNPIYQGTLPSAPAGWTPAPYRLSNTCLIVQIPVLNNHNDKNGVHKTDTAKIGWPLNIKSSDLKDADPTGAPWDNVETHVYMIVPSQDSPKEWSMQLATFGGVSKNGYDQQVHTRGPQTILTGIIGPLGSDGEPKIFQYINKIQPASVPADQIDDDQSPDYTGVIVNLEVNRHQRQNGANGALSQVPVALKLEIFMRNNALATSVGMPNSLPASSEDSK